MTQYLIVLIRALLVALWVPTAAMAATLTFEQSFDSMSAGFVAMVGFLACLGGVTALLISIEHELRAAPDARLPRPALFVAINLMGSLLAGAVSFMGAEGMGLNKWIELMAVTAASFYGARFIERVADAILNRAGATGRGYGFVRDFATLDEVPQPPRRSYQPRRPPLTNPDDMEP